MDDDLHPSLVHLKNVTSNCRSKGNSPKMSLEISSGNPREKPSSNEEGVRGGGKGKRDRRERERKEMERERERKTCRKREKQRERERRTEREKDRGRERERESP
jgi:hypothetical protein